MPEEINGYKDIEFNEILTKDEFFKLSNAVRRDGQIDESELEKLVNWVIAQRTGSECVELILEGFLTVDGFDGDEPRLLPPEEVIAAFNQRFIELPKQEEMPCGIS